VSEILYSETRESRLGAFARRGGQLDLYGDWVPGHSPDDAAALLMGVAGYLQNVEVPLEAAQGIAIEDTKRRFETETDPDEEPWVQLNEEYRTYKVDQLGYPDKILERTGDLKEAAPKGWEVIGATLIWNPKVLPTSKKGFQYGIAHQTGSEGGFETKPIFEFVPHVGHVEKARRQQSGLPRRAFIGLSDQAVEEIAAEFEQWSAGWTTGGGGPEMKIGSNVLGEFPIIGFYGEQPLLRLPSGRVSFGRIPR
jgi:phage gpG-like protein